MRKWIFSALVLALAVGCTQDKKSGDKRFLVPWVDQSGNYKLEQVTLSTLDNALEMKGSAAEIYFQNGFSDNGYQGSIARPHLTLSGDLYVFQDSDSAMAIAAYAQMERLYQYEQVLGTAGQISWPRQVGVDLNMTGPTGAAHDNAHYFSDLDVMGLLPYTQGGVPLALNHGVVAHEHFHAHFQHEVMRSLDHTLSKPLSLIAKMFYPFFTTGLQTAGGIPDEDDTTTPSFLNNIVLRAWNEGLADLFADIYIGQPDFFAASLPQQSIARKLNALTGTLMSGAQLQAMNNVPAARRMSPDDFVGLAYGQGTAMVRALYQIANNGTETPRKFMARLMGHLHEIPAAVNPHFTETVMNFEAALPVLLSDFPLNQATCQSLYAIATPQLIAGSFKQCANF